MILIIRINNIITWGFIDQKVIKNLLRVNTYDAQKLGNGEALKTYLDFYINRVWNVRRRYRSCVY